MGIHIICFFILGLFIGSFLNVLINRLPKEESIMGRSYCPYCKKKLEWQELFPVLSFVLLGAKCSGCKKKISFQYPLVEIITGILFAFSMSLAPNYFLFSFGGDFLINLITIFLTICLLSAISALLVIFVTDFKYMIVPDKVIYPAMMFAIFYQIFKILNQNLISGSKIQFFDFAQLGYAILSGIVALLFFLFLVIITKGKGMGLGDVKIAAFMGFLLGPSNLAAALFLSFISGSVIGLVLILLKRKTFKSEVPFGCFLAPATFISMFWGQEIINYYFEILMGIW